MQSPVKFLLVDDVEDNLLVLSALLRRNDIELLKARSGAEALELLLVHDVALALLDVQMPNMDGFQLAELMRGSDRTRDIPIIFITAGAYDQNRLFKGYESGAVDFLYKPIDPHILKSKADVFFQLYRQKQQLSQELQEKTETLRLNEMFVAVLGHDLRNPLNAVVTAADFLNHYSADDKVKNAATRVLRSSKRMSRMIDDLLNLARARLAGGIPISHQPSDLGLLAQRVVQECYVAFPERSIKLTTEGDLSGSWDSDRLAQVLSNLIGNALQHGEEKTVVRVQVDGTGKDNVVLSVVNAGCIPEEILPFIFDPFRGRNPESTKSEGLGLGLYIVQQIVHAHMGTIDVDCSDGIYTIFKITIPRTVT